MLMRFWGVIAILFCSVIYISCGGGSNNSPSTPTDPNAPQSVSGTISQDTTWQNNILITDHVIVSTGVTLTVMPGTTVQFKHYRGYQDPDNRLIMNVMGTIKAEGTQEAPIYFTSDAESPQNGDWSMIRLENSDDSVFRYCVVEFGQQGINVWDGAPIIDHCVIRWHNWEGLYFESFSQPTIQYTRIVENGYNGLAAEQFNTISMDYCEVWRSGTNGVHIDASTADIEHSLIHDNMANGLSMDNNSSLQVVQSTITENVHCGIGFGEGNNTLTVTAVATIDNGGEEICGEYTETASDENPVTQIDFGFEADQSSALGYIPGDQALDQYQYVYPDDATRSIRNKIGQGLGLTWSLAWDGEHIWTATLDGNVYELDPETGEVVSQFTTTMPQPWGMTYDGNHLWIVDFAEKRYAKFDPETGEELASYPSPDPIGGCKGIAWDGTALSIMGWTSPTIYRMALTGELISTIDLRHGGGGGLAWTGSNYWVPTGGRIAQYNTSGNRTGWIYAASEGTWDLTWDGQYLWASQRTNENWDDEKIFQLEVLELQ